MRHQQTTILGRIVNILAHANEMTVENKIKQLTYAAYVCWLRKDNLKYLEIELAIKELKDGKISTNI